MKNILVITKENKKWYKLRSRLKWFLPREIKLKVCSSNTVIQHYLSGAEGTIHSAIVDSKSPNHQIAKTMIHNAGQPLDLWGIIRLANSIKALVA